MLPEIKRRNIYEQVIEHLRQYIMENALKPGDRLPTEQELAEQFHVSRHAVREGVKVLESVGLIETRPRDGSRLKSFSTRPLTGHLRFLYELDGITVQEMATARQVIECAIVPLVVQNAGESHYAAMEAAIESMRELTAHGQTFAEADSEFHQTLASATGNRVMAGFGQMLQDFFAQLKRHISANSARQKQSIQEHRNILAALRAGDVHLAQDAIRTHLSVYDSFPDGSLFWQAK